MESCLESVIINLAELPGVFLQYKVKLSKTFLWRLHSNASVQSIWQYYDSYGWAMDSNCVISMWSSFWGFVKEFIPIACAVAGVYLAWSGIDTWKKQLRSSSGYNLAQKMLHTVAVSSSLVKILNNGLNIMGLCINFNAPPEQTTDLLDQQNLEKLIYLQSEMELLREEALATLGSKASSYDELYTFIVQYTAIVKITLLSLKNEGLRKQMASFHETLSGHVPLVAKEEYLPLMHAGKMPEYHEVHEKLINKVKSDLTPYLQHI